MNSMLRPLLVLFVLLTVLTGVVCIRWSLPVSAKRSSRTKCPAVW